MLASFIKSYIFYMETWKGFKKVTRVKTWSFFLKLCVSDKSKIPKVNQFKIVIAPVFQNTYRRLALYTDFTLKTCGILSLMKRKWNQILFETRVIDASFLKVFSIQRLCKKFSRIVFRHSLHDTKIRAITCNQLNFYLIIALYW